MTTAVLLLALVHLVEAPAPAPSGPTPEHGPFFAPTAASESQFPSGPPSTAPPRFSVGKGAFCFVEDAQCRSALIASVDVGIGVNAIAGDRGVDLPYAHYNFRGGFSLRPITLVRKRWNPWSVGLIASWSRGTGVVANTGSVVDAADQVVQTTPHTTAYRFGLVNQLWLSQKRNAFHVDLTVGVVRSSVLTYTGWYNGTHLEVAAGWAGWGGFFVSGDFLDGDTRVITGFRAHAIPALPAIGLVLLGLLAGGAMGQ
ncbi:hypothetical protein [Nannocystis radixulma]|uniref:Uncharacterized protein n=1 Tax=Nannocystis radixulma TaxID=2995305 RepID=A0ABT5BAN8_9BACT|nr:hypothetical protein [Nannocystis radixulma]MDC0670056.1 hypothetical protein [Nannocystis radixulma]